LGNSPVNKSLIFVIWRRFFLAWFMN